MSRGYSENPKRQRFSTHVALYTEFFIKMSCVLSNDKAKVNPKMTTTNKSVSKIITGNDEHIRSRQVGGPLSIVGVFPDGHVETVAYLQCISLSLSLLFLRMAFGFSFCCQYLSM